MIAEEIQTMIASSQTVHVDIEKGLRLQAKQLIKDIQNAWSSEKYEAYDVLKERCDALKIAIHYFSSP